MIITVSGNSSGWPINVVASHILCFHRVNSASVPYTCMTLSNDSKVECRQTPDEIEELLRKALK